MFIDLELFLEVLQKNGYIKKQTIYDIVSEFERPFGELRDFVEIPIFPPNSIEGNTHGRTDA